MFGLSGHVRPTWGSTSCRAIFATSAFGPKPTCNKRLNQNSPIRTCFRKVFFASGRKKVLQQILVIVLQNSANERSVPKMGNIGIQMAGFLKSRRQSKKASLPLLTRLGSGVCDATADD